jgi:hypothetical protein
MPKYRRSDGAREVPLASAGRQLPALVKRLGEVPGSRIALTVRGQVRAYLVAAPEDDEPSSGVSRLVKKVLKAARE